MPEENILGQINGGQLVVSVSVLNICSMCVSVLNMYGISVADLDPSGSENLEHWCEKTGFLLKDLEMVFQNF